MDYLRNETLKTIVNRHSIRTFNHELPVPDDCINTILYAANQAPSAHNQQSWRFIVIRGAKRVDFASLISHKATHLPKPSSALLRMAARSIASAQAVIAVVNTGELIERGPQLFELEKEWARDFFRIMEIQSSAAAVENMLLAATSMGLGAVWLGILILIKKDVLEFLGEPHGEFMAVIPVGYPTRLVTGPQKRNLDVIVRYL
ncbi:nitroreductase family protein [bacterium]|nr:nitroreductase family protein [candidate division CSSED10-310 bacterium]